MRKYRFHMTTLAHVPFSNTFNSCAFTQKYIKLTKMLMSLGHEVYVYGCIEPGAEVIPCTEFVETHTIQDIRDHFGDEGNNEGLGYNWQGVEAYRWKDEEDKRADPLLPTLKQIYLERTSEEINKRKQMSDFLLINQGTYHKPIGDATGLVLAVEPGVGYRNSYCKFRAFESAFIQNYTYGYENGRNAMLGKFLDRVIPNYFDVNQFPYRKNKEDFYLYLGRLTPNKGIHIAIKTCEALGKKLVIAGQGEYIGNSPVVEAVGYADIQTRADLMGRAKGFFYPTLYIEPFGGAAVEAQLCGTPVITTNFGAFTETVVDGVSGFRCNTFRDFVKAAQLVEKLDPYRCRVNGERYSMERVKWEYQEWFDQIYDVLLQAKGEIKDAWYKLDVD